MPGLRVRELARELENAKAALALAERKIQEQSEIVCDLMLWLGSRKTCTFCGNAVVWIPWRGCGDAIPFNIDGSMHWPRCRETARPKESAAEGKTA